MRKSCINAHRLPGLSGPHTGKSVRYCKGVTLVEMFITVTVLGILATVAIPGFNELLAATKINRGVDNFRTTVDLSRTSALTDSINVAICPSSNPDATTPSCSAASEKNYEDGWLVYRECNGNGDVDLGINVCDGGTTPEYILNTQSALDNIEIESSDTTRMNFDDSGRLATPVSFDIENGHLAYTIAVNLLGHIRVSESTPSL